MTHTLAWGAKVSPAFRDAIFAIQRGMKWPEDGASSLMACMAFETGATFDPGIRNRAGSSGTGLIQFMRATAVQLGTTTDALAAMDAVTQLGFVARYLSQFRALVAWPVTVSDLYMSILSPRFIGEPDDALLFSAGLAYSQNAGLDKNHDHRITKAEAASGPIRMLALGLTPANVWTQGAAA